MEIENRTDSVFTDKTNTIPKPNNVKALFTKPGNIKLESQNIEPVEEIITTAQRSDTRYATYFEKTGITSITP